MNIPDHPAYNAVLRDLLGGPSGGPQGKRLDILNDLLRAGLVRYGEGVWCITNDGKRHLIRLRKAHIRRSRCGDETAHYR